MGVMREVGSCAPAEGGEPSPPHNQEELTNHHRILSKVGKAVSSRFRIHHHCDVDLTEAGRSAYVRRNPSAARLCCNGTPGGALVLRGGARQGRQAHHRGRGTDRTPRHTPCCVFRVVVGTLTRAVNATMKG